MDNKQHINLQVMPGGKLTGNIRVPGDKSISHRAIMLGAIAEGITDINGFLKGTDCLATLDAFTQMGVSIKETNTGQIQIEGVGLHGLTAPNGPLNLGNSGTSMRLLAGLLAGQRFPVTLTGDASLLRRPMRRVTEPLALMGAKISANEQGTAPLHIEPVPKLQSIPYALPIASAQVKSCLLLAGLYAQGTTCVREPTPSRDHTERMLQELGYAIQYRDLETCLTGGGTLQGHAINVPGDISSAAFFLVGASIAPQSDLTLQQVGINPTRLGIVHILRAMGANINISNVEKRCGEPIADIRIQSAKLHGINIPKELIPVAIDEFPAVFIAAACAEGKTILHGASELRVKESDRIQAMADGLNNLGIVAKPYPDGIYIEGGKIASGTILSLGDHRIAMAFAIAGLRAAGEILIKDCANVHTSFPGFVELAASIGLNIKVLPSNHQSQADL